MSADEPIELLLERDARGLRLLSPGVGWFCGALAQGELLGPGHAAGELITLGRRRRLIVPEGASGIVRNPPPARLRAAVGYGELLYELGALNVAEALPERVSDARSAGDDELGVRAPQTGRFYHRSAPGEPSLCEVGRELEVGTPIGVIEVMPTFTQGVYRAERGLPARARIVHVIAPDGGDVHEGKPLLIVAAR